MRGLIFHPPFRKGESGTSRLEPDSIADYEKEI
jgi:hypothetical protein